MRVRLLVAMKSRLPGGGHRILSPGIYDDKDGNFPEVLREESRFGIVEVIDSAPAEMPGPVEDDLESDEEVEEETEEEVEEVETPKKKKKRRG